MKKSKINIDAGQQWEKYRHKTIKVLDIQGQVVKSIKLTEQFLSLATVDLESGIYILKLGDQIRKFIKD